MSDNLELWNKLGKTDPAHTKSFTRAGGFRGTAIKPMWSYHRMTEEFGPCGIGWGIGYPQFQVVAAGDETLVYCTASVWYRDADNCVYGVGGDKVLSKTKNGLATDDEAFKKAFTDAVTNALKLIGVGADVHMGMFDDSKYVNEMKAEFAEPKQEVAAPKPANQLKKNGSWEALMAEIDAEMAKGPSLVEFDTELKRFFWNKGRSLGFNDTWMEALKDVLIRAREEIEKASVPFSEEKNAGDLAVAAIKNMGGRVVDERVMSTLEAGE